MAIESNHSPWLGDDIELTLTLSAADIPPTVGIAGWTITLNMAASVGGTVVVTATASIVSALQGTFKFTIPSASTLSLAARTYVWDARRTDAGSRDTLAFGTMAFRSRV